MGYREINCEDVNWLRIGSSDRLLWWLGWIFRFSNGFSWNTWISINCLGL